MRKDDAFWDLGVLPKEKKSDTRPRLYDVSAVDVVADVPGEDISPDRRIPPRPTDGVSPTAPLRASDLFTEAQPKVKAATSAPASPAPLRRIPDRREPPKPQPSEKRGTYPDSPLRKYRPKSGMIREVEVFLWPSTYDFYAQFRRDAMRYYAVEGKRAPRVAYFSYIPQYSQLNHAQLAYYLWWRENVRAGRCPEADFSYVLLYIYEILNLPDRIPPKEGMTLLCDVWLAYRHVYPKLDKYMSEWICDYGLIYGIACPAEKLAAVIPVCLENCTLREYYVAESDLAVALAEYASYHSFRKTKYAKGEYAPLFEKYVPMALAYTIDAAARDGIDAFSFEDMRIYRTERDAFSGSLCAHNVKRRVVVSYFSLGRSHELRELVTNIVKYTENGIRAHVKIRSMLSVGNLPPEIRGYVDAFLRQTFGLSAPGARRSQSRTVREREAYEKLYDVPDIPVSAERAREIEHASWSATDVLTAAFADEKTSYTNDENKSAPVEQKRETPDEMRKNSESTIACKEPSVPIPRAESYANAENRLLPNNPYSELILALGDTERRVLWACLDGEDIQPLCRAAGMLADAVVSTINERASDLTGDILIEAAEGGYHIMEDYTEELSECRMGI